MEILKIKRVSTFEYYNIYVESRTVKIFLCFFNIKFLKYKEYFLCTKSKYQKNIELQDAEYRQDQNNLLWKATMTK